MEAQLLLWYECVERLKSPDAYNYYKCLNYYCWPIVVLLLFIVHQILNFTIRKGKLLALLKTSSVLEHS